MSSVYRLRFDPAALKDWLAQLDDRSANGLISAVDDGIFERFIKTERVLDIVLEDQERPPIVPFATQLKIKAAGVDYDTAYAESRYDAVVMASVLQMVENPIWALGFAFDQLENGGRLIITVPHRDLFEKRLRPPSKFASRHRQFYTTDRLIQHVHAACGINAVRLRFAKEYDAAHDYGAGRPNAEYSLVAVFERMGRLDRFEDVEQIEIKRLRDVGAAKPEALLYGSPASVLAAGLTTADVRRIIVLKLDHLGDFAMTAPRFQELRELFPTAEITLVCGPWNRSFAESLRLFDAIFDCEYYKQDEKFGGQPQDVKALEAQKLGAAFRDRQFDLAIDFRVPTDSRRLLELFDARIRAGIGAAERFPFLDIALPSMESFNGLQAIPDHAEIVWSPGAFRYHSPHSVLDGVAVCHPDTEDYFISGPYGRLGAGRYVGGFNIRLFGRHDYDSVRVNFDIAVSGGRVVFTKELAVTAESGLCAFEFDAFVDLKEVEFRVRLGETPASPPAFLFLGVKMTFVSATSARRLLPLASIHIAEHVTLLLALIRSRLASAGLSAELSGRLAGPDASDAGESSADYIAVAPFSNSLLRDWPIDHYRDLVRSILKRTTARIKLLGSNAQAPLLGRLVDQLEADADPAERIEVLAGLDLNRVFGIVRSAATTITNNSGLAHIAALLGAPSISIYSGSHQTLEWGPLGRQNVALQAAVECGPCGYDTIAECLHGHKCMRLISVGDVMAIVQRQASQVFLGADVA